VTVVDVWDVEVVDEMVVVPVTVIVVVVAVVVVPVMVVEVEVEVSVVEVVVLVTVVVVHKDMWRNPEAPWQADVAPFDKSSIDGTFQNSWTLPASPARRFCLWLEVTARIRTAQTATATVHKAANL